MEKLTAKSILENIGQTGNKLFKSVVNDIFKGSTAYAGKTKAEKIIAYCYDIDKNGFNSGIVEKLAYTNDIILFYNRYETEIKDIIEHLLQDGVYNNITEFYGYNNLDPFFRTFDSKKMLVYTAYQYAVWEVLVYVEGHY